MIAVVYSKAQKVMRRMIVLDHANAKHEDFNPHKETLHEGEGWLEISADRTAKFTSFEDLYTYLASIIGSPENDRCVVVCPEGNVKAVVRADPTIDTHPEGEIIEHSCADKEWKMSKGNWVEPVKGVL